ncbi:MAG: UDP-N-acetylmuramoyl-L-alanyl-D-glutamate--2,6-diaminopimelate ligase [Bacillota bacterium]|nr:UDP-N-acetylmuramoyl-L-alanyl-D-glutamate--2,6-diaminopimelate ligase [Bacillota bacterium]MDK2925232.1 UDP-N-acetylmuramoyl-L-alanyl-D-glutamate--2,6-diaminopimelate ligase [Bacillota bacterium]
MGVPLPELAALLRYDPLAVPPLCVRGITCDSRLVKPGDLFVAVRGSRFDGHAFIGEACLKGAVAVVAEVQEQAIPVPCLIVPDSRLALAELAAHFYGHPSRSLEVVGVTGTNGKTTTACMIEHILRTAGHPTGLIGTVGVKYRTAVFPAHLTTPGADELQAHLAAMRAEGLRFVVMEVSSQGVKTGRIHGLRFSFGVLTNITLDHLDTHASFQEYMAMKKRFLDMLAPDRTVFVNCDDLGARTLLENLSARVVTFGCHPQSDLQITQLANEPGGTRFTLLIRRPVHTHSLTVAPLTLPLGLRILGAHNAANAAAAAGVALALGVEAKYVAKALATFPGVERRLEVYRLGKVTVIDDTALNPASLEAIFAAVTHLPYRRLLVVYALRGRRGPAVNRINALVIAQWAQRLSFNALITTNAVYHVGPNDTVTPEEEAAFFATLRACGLTSLHFPDLKEALAAALNRIRPGDLLLLLGAQGMDAGHALLQDLWTERRANFVPVSPAEVALAGTP